jgi:GNAT superfamily N-acetyltransferase
VETVNDGYTDLPPGKLAAVVTYLEMRIPPLPELPPATPEYHVRRVERPDLDWYRDLYRRIGEPWLWFSRLRMNDDELRGILHHAEVDVFALTFSNADAGLLEFDRRLMPDIELTFFGIIPELIGKNAGRELLQYGLAAEWKHRPRRVWLHTCTHDHPRALEFYCKAGFVPYKRGIEIADDPRLTGDVPSDAAPSIPIL